ncbi:hypothetical protein R3P38DRAFT_3027345 [Favolaschia claudopus]|uniref:F-box domain-containing protein n=1 Tax=Favolaschia claudopus TaxID=2862362 RepID=A0AAW0AGC8_9AGAR
MDPTVATAFYPLSGSDPDPFEEARIADSKACLAASKSRIAASEERIARYHETMNTGVLATLKFEIVPIRILPDKLLTSIFRCAIGAEYGASDRVRRVLDLSQVCKLWRTLALQNPDLWTTQLPIKYKSSADKPYSAEYVAMTKVYQERSAPLPIAFDCIHRNTILPALADVLLSAAPRWHELSVTGHHSMVQAIVALPPDTFRELRSAQLDMREPLHRLSSSAFVSASQLREVSLNFVDHPQSYGLGPLMPWLQLTCLTLHRLPLHYALSIVVQCTHLEKVSIQTLPHDDESVIPARKVTTLSQLRKLDITLSARHVEPWFRQVTFPNLETLEISHCGKGEGWDDDLRIRVWGQAGLAVFLSFLRRTPNIECFSLTSCNLEPQQLHDILVHCPALTKLTLFACGYCINDDPLGALEYSQNDVVHLVPRLRKLLLGGVNELSGNFNENKLLSMIRSRWWTPAALQTLPAPPPVAVWETIEIEPYEHAEWEPSAEFQNEIKRLNSEGLDIYA